MSSIIVMITNNCDLKKAAVLLHSAAGVVVSACRSGMENFYCMENFAKDL